MFRHSIITAYTEHIRHAEFKLRYWRCNCMSVTTSKDSQSLWKFLPESLLTTSMHILYKCTTIVSSISSDILSYDLPCHAHSFRIPLMKSKSHSFFPRTATLWNRLQRVFFLTVTILTCSYCVNRYISYISS